MADRYGYILRKSPRRDPQAPDYGGFMLSNSFGPVLGGGRTLYAATLDEVEQLLERTEAEERDGYPGLTPVEPETVVSDRASQRIIMRLAGHLPLPVGSVVELRRGGRTGTAYVERVRILNAVPEVHPPRGAVLCLDCRVEGWWEADDS